VFDPYGLEWKPLFVSRLKPETTSADVSEFIHQEFPSQNITVEEFIFPYVRRISSFKISAPPEVFNVLNSKSLWLNDKFVIKEFFPHRRRTNNRTSTTEPAPKNGAVYIWPIKMLGELI